MNFEADALLTVIVPTYNREKFVARLLAYAVEVRFPFRILIVDSSHEPDRMANESRVAATRLKLSLEYMHVNCGLMEKLARAVERVETAYCCMWADDDFQVPEGLSSCIRFLEVSPEFGSCMGQFLAVRRKNPEWDLFLETYPSREELAAFERILRWSENFYSNFYAVYRTSGLRQMLQIAVQASCYERCRIIPEILIGQVGLLLGRQRMIDEVSIVYQMHPANDSRVTPCVRDRAAFPTDYQRYREILARKVMDVTESTELEADRLVDQSFRNIHPWTGGRGRWRIRLWEKLCRPWKRMRLKRDARRLIPRFSQVRKEPLLRGDARLVPGNVSVALRWIDLHPAGIDAAAGTLARS
jgi:glycosyltransferase domain-containing protein